MCVIAYFPNNIQFSKTDNGLHKWVVKYLHFPWMTTILGIGLRGKILLVRGLQRRTVSRAQHCPWQSRITPAAPKGPTAARAELWARLSVSMWAGLRKAKLLCSSSWETEVRNERERSSPVWPSRSLKEVFQAGSRSSLKPKTGLWWSRLPPAAHAHSMELISTSSRGGPHSAAVDVAWGVYSPWIHPHKQIWVGAAVCGEEPAVGQEVWGSCYPRGQCWSSAWNVGSMVYGMWEPVGKPSWGQVRKDSILWEGLHTGAGGREWPWRNSRDKVLWTDHSPHLSVLLRWRRWKRVDG